MVEMKFGFMQGRLTDKGGFYPQLFPANEWEKEFETASGIGFDSMEWMFNYERWEKNPIIDVEQVHKISRLSKENHVVVSGICANYFMKKNIFDAGAVKENCEILKCLVRSAEILGCPNIIIPLFEKSQIQKDNRVISEILKKTANKQTHILFEADVEMEELEKWLKKLNVPNTGVCYDIGNAAGLERNIVKEIKNHMDIIKNIHIKDKKKKGKTVMLGQGDACFEEILGILKAQKYKGYCILESYYGVDAVKDTMKNFEYVKELIIK